MPQFSLEPLSACQAEVQPILRNEHWPEVGHYKDIPIDMQWDKYALLQECGKLRCFTARSPLNEEFKESVLLGYAFYIVDKHLHYKDTLVASQDILYVRPEHRGFGRQFIAWCDEQLRAEGVITVSHHVKPWFDWGHMAQELGYEKAETIWTRRLD